MTDLLGRSDVQAAFRQAYSDSIWPNGLIQEQGGWIYANRFDATDIVIIRASGGQLALPVASDNLQGNLVVSLLPPALPSSYNYRMVADFHTHPAHTSNGIALPDDPPSLVDIGAIFAGQTPGFVIASEHTWTVGPNSRATMDGPRGYAVTVDALTEANVPQGYAPVLQGWTVSD